MSIQSNGRIIKYVCFTTFSISLASYIIKRRSE